jgi:hypothetical protein
VTKNHLYSKIENNNKEKDIGFCADEERKDHLYPPFENRFYLKKRKHHAKAMREKIMSVGQERKIA